MVFVVANLANDKRRYHSQEALTAQEAVGFQVRISAPDVSKEATPLGSRGEKLKPMSADRVAVSNS